MTSSSRIFRMVQAKIVRYWHKLKGPIENEELQAQKLQDRRSQGQKENDVLMAQKSQGISENTKLLAAKSQGFSIMIWYWRKNRNV